jgi:quercetin dioxygenase-like cupin family protein
VTGRSTRPPGEAGGRPVELLTRTDLLSRPVTDLPAAHLRGHVRTAYPGLAAETFRTTLVVMPAGQQSPPRTSEIDHIIVVLEGAFVFSIDDVRYRVEKLDQLLVPFGVVWEYENAAGGESSFLSVVGP